MKINTNNDTVVERTGIQHDGAFKMNFDAKMAKILSDGLYSNKIEAICRELGCNAIDSHVEAGVPDLPIEVHLPNTLEPWFHVQDFGVGLDHEQVLDIYTVYGASTKTLTNDAIGQLGLGSKSPFSYCDAFDVTARKNGMERQYSMYKNEQGMPCCALLLERPTTERNGVQIKIPVQSKDFGNFAESARNVYRWFAVKPVITGRSEFKISPIEYEYTGADWSIAATISRAYGSRVKCWALMGPVAYPIAAENLPNLDAQERKMMDLPLVLKFGIGDLEVAVSREALSYDPRTCAALKTAIAKSMTELGKQISDKFAHAKTLWEAHQLHHEIFNSCDYRYELRNVYGSVGISWKHHLIKGREINIPTVSLYGKDHSPEVLRLYSSYKRCRRERTYDSIQLSPGRTKVVFDDLGKGTSSRLNYFNETNNSGMEIQCFPPSPVLSWDQMKMLMGDPEVVFASEMPKKKSEKVKTTTLRYRHGYKANSMNSWDQVDIDLADGGYYVRLNRWTAQEDDDAGRVCNIQAIMEHVLYLKIDLAGPVYAARDVAMRQEMHQNPKWINILDHLRAKVMEVMTPVVISQIAAQDDYRKACSYFYDQRSWKMKYDLDANSPWMKFITGMQDLEARANNGRKMMAWCELATLLGIKVADLTSAKPSETVALAESINSLYPMAKGLLDHWFDQNAANKVTQYVRDMDELAAYRAANPVKKVA